MLNNFSFFGQFSLQVRLNPLGSSLGFGEAKII
jgi:hypothetical protein